MQESLRVREKEINPEDIANVFVNEWMIVACDVNE